MANVAHIPLDLTLQAGAWALSRPVEHDVDDLFAACQDPDILRFTRVPRPYTLDHARGFVSHAEHGAREGTHLTLVVRDRDERLLGTCGLVRIDQGDLVGEVGYWVAPWARRRGVATAASRALARFAFDGLGLARLHLEAATANPASNAVARRLGFVHEGTLRRGASDPGGTPAGPDAADGAELARFDMHVWGLLPGELT